MVTFLYECFNTISNISFQRSGISLDLLFGHRVSNIRSNVIMYVTALLPLIEFLFHCYVLNCLDLLKYKGSVSL